MSEAAEHLLFATLAASQDGGKSVTEQDRRILQTLIDSFEEVSGNIRGTAAAFSARMSERGISIDDLQTFISNTQDQSLMKILGKLMRELHHEYGAHPRSLMGLTLQQSEDAAASITEGVIREVIQKHQSRR